MAAGAAGALPANDTLAHLSTTAGVAPCYPSRITACLSLYGAQEYVSITVSATNSCGKVTITKPSE